MKHGFVKVAAASPAIRLADCNYNARVLADTARTAFEQDGVRVMAFPELCLTGATCGDLFLQRILLDGAMYALEDLLIHVKNTEVLFTVGLPMTFGGKVYENFDPNLLFEKLGSEIDVKKVQYILFIYHLAYKYCSDTYRM